VLTLAKEGLLSTLGYVGGHWRPAVDGATFDVVNPADGGVVARVADYGADEAADAIAAAEAALPAWRAALPKERSDLLRRWHDLVLQHQEDLARILTAEQGKPLAEARGEILYGTSFIEWFAEEGKRIYGDTMTVPGRDKHILVVKQPVGVVAAITPWNFPNAMITRKIAPALAAGCKVIVKPSEETPLSALALMVLAEEAGMPAGVLNVLATTKAAAVGGRLMAVIGRAQGVLHRLDGGGQAADAAKRCDLEGAVFGTGWQRAFHRLRGRRYRCGRGGAIGGEVP